MDYKGLVEKLKEMLPEKIPYGELVGAPWPYTNQGEMVYPNFEDYIIEQAATAIIDLLARAEAAETRAEKLEKEKDTAINNLRVCSIEGFMQCQYCLYKTAKSFCWNCTDGSGWKYRGEQED